MSRDTVLEVTGLSLRIGGVQAVDGVDVVLRKGVCTALVGESGCGKSLTGLSLMGLQPAQADCVVNTHRVLGEDVAEFSEAQWREWRGRHLAMVFQNPMTALNPLSTVGRQLMLPLQQRKGLDSRAARAAALSLLEQMAIQRVQSVFNAYPFQLSGGMLQRVMIAMALSADPEVLIADEPTTALDVTVQAGVLSLLRRLMDEQQRAVLFITHDMGVVAQLADEVAVMYAGRIVEAGPVHRIFDAPAHPYTRSLLAAIPGTGRDLQGIPGTPPRLAAPAAGCGFVDRCSQAKEACQRLPPVQWVPDGGWSRCVLPQGSRS